MRRESKPFTTREAWLQYRANFLTSTETAALFGCSPYATEFELYHRHLQNLVTELEPNERMKWGSRLQDAIAAGVAEDQGWTIQKMDEFIAIPDLRIGASFDFRIVVGDEPGPEDGLLEIKNVDSLIFRDGWLVDDDGSIEAPPQIEIQLQTQFGVSELKWGYIGALVGGNDIKLLKREADGEIWKAIEGKSKEFWKRIDQQDAPAPDFIRDADFIKSIYQSVQPGLIMQSDPLIFELAASYNSLGQQIKELEGQRAGCKAQLLTLIGDAEKVIDPMFSISAGVTSETVVESFVRKAFRNFRVTWKKVK